MPILILEYFLFIYDLTIDFFYGINLQLPKRLYNQEVNDRTFECQKDMGKTFQRIVGMLIIIFCPSCRQTIWIPYKIVSFKMNKIIQCFYYKFENNNIF